jgi:predicted metal-dependent hydrolase
LRTTRGPLHPTFSPEERRRLVHEGIALFNRGAFYDAHEVWEDVWRSTSPQPNDLFQGLIQVAAGMHQILDLHRVEGPRSTLEKGTRRLESYAPAALGLDVAALLEEVRLWQAWLEDGNGEQPPLPAVRVLDPAAVV